MVMIVARQIIPVNLAKALQPACAQVRVLDSVLEERETPDALWLDVLSQQGLQDISKAGHRASNRDTHSHGRRSVTACLPAAWGEAGA